MKSEQHYQHYVSAVVRSIADVADDVRLFDIVPDDGIRPYQVGSHIDIRVMVGEQPDDRSFSLVGEFADGDGYRIAVKNRPDGHGGSRYLWSLAPGARVKVSDPEDNFPLSWRAPEYLLVAGGIGITPIYGMARALVRHGARVRLLYTAREAGQLAFAAELREVLGKRLALYVTSEDNRLVATQAFEGLDANAELYICGPLSLRQDFMREWLAQDRPQGRFRFETFASSGQYPDEAFDVHIRNRDMDIRVEQGQTLLNALQRHGVHDVLYDCERGECGLCTVNVVDHSGELDHRDVFYSDRQRAGDQRICTCVSRVHAGSLVIDTSRHAVDTGQFDA